MLATVHKETGSTFIPNEEIGKGAGHPNYNTVYEVIDVQATVVPRTHGIETFIMAEDIVI